MIDNNWIIKTAVKLQTSEVNIRREYYQNIILSHLYRIPSSAKLLFKGGTSLRLVYDSPRFSEDLDFDASKLAPTEIENLILDAGEEMNRENLGFDISEAVKTKEGYIAKLSFPTESGLLIIKTDFSLRKTECVGEVRNIKGIYLPPFQLVVLEKEKIADGKLAALLDRGKPRDFYDLYFMLRALMLNNKQKDLLDKVLPIVEKTKTDFNKELKVFLPKTHWLIIKDLKKSLLSEIRQQLRN